jgi:uncharacterized phage protein (TIGR02216 family)
MNRKIGLDWAGLLRLGLGQLGLKPYEFWELTPVELMIMAGLETQQTAFLGRPGIDRLMGLYPDKTKEE